MKILTISHNGQQSQLQCDDDVAKIILSKDTDPSLKERLINSLLRNSRPQSCSRQLPLDSSQPQLGDSQPQIGNNQLQSFNRQLPLDNSQPQLSNSQPQLGNNQLQSFDRQLPLNGSQPQLGNSQPQSCNRQPPLDNSQHYLGDNRNQLSASQSESSCQSEGGIHTWKCNEEDLLVSLRHEKDEQFTRTKNHNMLWRAIAEEINKTLNCKITSTQAMNKYFSLKKKWKEVVDAGTGTEAKSFRQKYQFDQLYGTKASTKPEFILDSGKSLIGNQDTAKAEMSGDLQMPSGSKQMTGKLKESKTKMKRKSTEIVEIMERHNTEFHNRMEQHHQAKMSRMDRFLDLYEKDVNSKVNGN